MPPCDNGACASISRGCLVSSDALSNDAGTPVSVAATPALGRTPAAPLLAAIASKQQLVPMDVEDTPIVGIPATTPARAPAPVAPIRVIHFHMGTASQGQRAGRTGRGKRR